MIFQVLEKKIAAAGLAVEGESLFRNAMGSEVNVGVLIRPPLTGISIDPFIEGWFKTDIQIIVRHTDPVEGMKLANQISKLLLVEVPEVTTLSEGRVSISMFYPKTLPVQFPRLAGNGYEFSQHFFTAFSVAPTWR